jgi:hypothetical protein
MYATCLAGVEEYARRESPEPPVGQPIMMLTLH